MTLGELIESGEQLFAGSCTAESQSASRAGVVECRRGSDLSDGQRRLIAVTAAGSQR